MTKILIKRSHIMVILVMMIFSMMIISAEPAFAATVKTIPSTSTKVANANKLKLSKSNYSVTWNASKHKVKTGAGSEKILCIPIKSTSSSWTVTNFAKVTFTNAGTINGRQVDVSVNFDSMTVTARKASSSGETSDGYMGFASIWDADEGLQVGVTIEDGCGYRAKKTVKYTATVYYHDTGATVNLPFFQVVRDIDAANDYYREGWENVSGYTGTYYKYSTNYNTFSGNQVLAPSGTGNTVTGNNELLKAGIYAPTTGGSFSAKFYEGNSGTLINLYSQYSTSPSVFKAPTKTVDKAKAMPGEEVTYKITHTMGTFYQTAMTVYGKLEFKDVLPAGLSYKSCKLTNGSGSDITSSGTVIYDEDTRTLTFAMGDTWRNNISNYNGQKLTLTIVAEVEEFDLNEITANNTADISLENAFAVTTNQVTTRLYNLPMIQIIKRIPASADQIGNDHGNPTFIFKIANTTTGDAWYRSVTFGDDEASKGWTLTESDGYKVMTGLVEEFPEGDYEVTEIGVSRFKLVSKDTSLDGRVTKYSFTNEKDNWQYFSHKSVVINTLSGGDASE